MDWANKSDIDKKIVLIRIILLCSFFLLALISFNLWIPISRTFPFSPVFEWMPGSNSVLHFLLPIPFFLLLFAFIYYGKEYQAWLIALFFIVLAALDQNRLQPYFYQLVLMIVVIAAVKPVEREQANHVKLSAFAVIMIAIYLWSGIQKLNPDFFKIVWPFMLEGFLPFEVNMDDHALINLGYIVPIGEILIGVGLLIPKLRTASVSVAIIMHLCIIYTLSPLANNWNLIVIPWNITMILLLILVFRGNKNSGIDFFYQLKHSLTATIVVFFFLVMPLFNFWGLWDHYLSFSLYSGKTSHCAIYVDKGLKRALPADIKSRLTKGKFGEHFELTYWAIDEMNVLPYPEKRSYKKVREALCAYKEGGCYAKMVFYK